MSYWNYRLVNMPEENYGEPYLELREVHYTDKGVPVGHTPANTGSETLEGITEILRWHSLALSKPILTEADFTGSFDDDDDDDDNGAWHEGKDNE